MTKTFRDLGVHADLCDALDADGITHPFPIQELTLPLALGGHDLIGQARTGTGKTLAFGLPLLQRIDPDKRATQALVVVPTRELCHQVHDDLGIGERLGLTTISVYGGVAYEPQIEALTTGVHVVVGTPGRLLDHLNRGNLDLSQVTQLVLDEGDEMLDMGFLPDVERLIEACPSEGRHTMLFSATMPTAIVKMARRYLDHPTFTRAESEAHDTSPTVEQHFLQVHRMDKPRVLARILQTKDRGGVYVFVRTKHMADRLVNELEELRVAAIAVHGDLRQQTREKNLERFRSGAADVLVATEVAARGLDVTGVSHVVNYDCPDDEKMYLHRIGRTARAGQEGVAVTFAEFNETDRLNVIRKAVGANDRDVEQVFSTSPRLQELFDLPEERPWDHLARSGGGSRGGGSRGGGSRGGGSRGGGAKRTGRSDGRSRNDRRREGRGGDRDASRSRGRGEPTDRGQSGEPARRRDRDTDAPSTGRERREGGDRPAATSQRSERTRTRQRVRDDAGGAREQVTDRDRSDRDRSGRSGGRNPRARPASERSPASGRRDERGPRDDRNTSASPAATEGSSRTNRRDDDRTRGGDSGAPNERGSSSRGGRSRGGSSGRDTASDRNRTSGRSGASGRSTSSGRNRSDRRGSNREDETRRERREPARRRGAEARGEGQPQRARRVKVEHLP